MTLPDRLTARIGGYPGPYYAITWAGDHLLRTARVAGFEEQRKVCRHRAGSWERFWHLLDEVDAWPGTGARTAARWRWTARPGRPTSRWASGCCALAA